MFCLTCGKDLSTSRKDKKFCSRLCYRRYPVNAARYSNRTQVYQTAHAKEPGRRYQKLVYKCKRENRNLGLSYGECWVLWREGCFYCRKDITVETGCGLDRLDNAKDYTLDNVVPCCGPCNKIRNVFLTHEEMVAAMSAVLTFRENLCATNSKQS